jgi:hypothetical protein
MFPSASLGGEHSPNEDWLDLPALTLGALEVGLRLDINTLARQGLFRDPKDRNCDTATAKNGSFLSLRGMPAALAPVSLPRRR